MTREQAEKLARTLWGDEGFAVVVDAGAAWFRVGRGGVVLGVLGEAGSWEGAFVAAGCSPEAVGWAAVPVACPPTVGRAGAAGASHGSPVGVDASGSLVGFFGERPVPVTDVVAQLAKLQQEHAQLLAALERLADACVEDGADYRGALGGAQDLIARIKGGG